MPSPITKDPKRGASRVVRPRAGGLGQVRAGRPYSFPGRAAELAGRRCCRQPAQGQCPARRPGRGQSWERRAVRGRSEGRLTGTLGIWAGDIFVGRRQRRQMAADTSPDTPSQGLAVTRLSGAACERCEISLHRGSAAGGGNEPGIRQAVTLPPTRGIWFVCRLDIMLPDVLSTIALRSR